MAGIMLILLGGSLAPPLPVKLALIGWLLIAHACVAAGTAVVGVIQSVAGGM